MKPSVSHRLLATRRREHARAERRLEAVKAQIAALDIKLCAAMTEEVRARYAVWNVAEALGLVVAPSTPNDE